MRIIVFSAVGAIMLGAVVFVMWKGTGTRRLVDSARQDYQRRELQGGRTSPRPSGAVSNEAPSAAVEAPPKTAEPQGTAGADTNSVP